VSIFAIGRPIVYLKRIAIALERLAEDLSAIREIYTSEWAAQHGPRPPSKAVEIGTMDQDEINRRYRQRIEEDLQA